MESFEAFRRRRFGGLDPRTRLVLLAPLVVAVPMIAATVLTLVATAPSYGPTLSTMVAAQVTAGLAGWLLATLFARRQLGAQADAYGQSLQAASLDDLARTAVGDDASAMTRTVVARVLDGRVPEWKDHIQVQAA